MHTLLKNLKDDLGLWLVLAVAGVLRFINLGYSDYQGDEIKALYKPAVDGPFFNFILDQRKGPVQFLITAFLRLFDPTYANQFLARIPFALAGFLAVWVFYLYTKQVFGKRVAVYAAGLLAVNGLFVAFSRIVQYQSLVVMWAMLALLCLKQKKILWGMVFWGLALLSHYDAVFIAPLAAYYLLDHYRTYTGGRKQALQQIMVAVGSLAVMLALFYVPFVFHISAETKSYWSGRLSGAGDYAEQGISDSGFLFRVYQPFYTYRFYQLFSALGLGAVALWGLQLRVSLGKFGQKVKDWGKARGLNGMELAAVGLWLLIALGFMEGLVAYPGTHIYIYLLPLIWLIALGMDAVEWGLGRFGWAAGVGLSVALAFFAMQSYAIFVENKSEYPWQKEKMLLWQLNPPDVEKYSVALFGFPYYRNWEGAAKFMAENSQAGESYNTNENNRLSEFYIHAPLKQNEPDYYIEVVNPQSYLESAHFRSQPLYKYRRNGEDLLLIYRSNEK